MIIGLGLAFISGIVLIDMSLTDPEGTLGSRIFGFVCGLILIAPGLLLLYGAIADRKKQKPETDQKKGESFRDIVDQILRPVRFDDDRKEDSQERFLHSFRRDLRDFFARSGIAQNSPIVNEVTQLYFYILALQKKRLDAKHITLDYKVNRYDYRYVPTVMGHSFFDGKYEISDIRETIRADKVFFKNGARRMRVRNQERADYRVIHAKEIGGNRVICPNCGAESTKSNLIDGCDYCGTKFRVEDFRRKISSFDVRSDARIEYAAYQAYRANYLFFFALLVSLPILIWASYWAIRTSGSIEGDLIVKLCIGFLVVAFVTAAFSYILWYFCLFTVFPLIQTAASVGYLSKKQLEKLKEYEHREKAITEEIRKNDPLFSLNGFYSYVTNQLARIHFAGSPAEAAGFTQSAAADRSIMSRFGIYADVIDMSVQDIDLVNYGIFGGFQKAEVAVRLRLVLERNGRMIRKEEKVRLLLCKNKDLKTQEICAPSFLRCPNCGASLSLLETKYCSHCGTSRRLSDYDWAIEQYAATM